MSFDGLKIVAQTFVEYHGGNWIEICGQRKYGSIWGDDKDSAYVPVSQRPNPEEYRVNDDDNGRFIIEGYC